MSTVVSPELETMAGACLGSSATAKSEFLPNKPLFRVGEPMYPTCSILQAGAAC